MSSDLSPLLELAQLAAERAARYLREAEIRSIDAKGDRDMVTDVDLAVERLIREQFRVATPTIGFFGEEEGQSGDSRESWVLDPIDGTANYLHGLPLVGISLALVRDQRAVLGVIELPFLGRTYRAADGLGAFRDGRPITAAPTTHLSEAIVAVGDYAHGPDAKARNETALDVHRALATGAQRVRMLGSAAVDLVLVAEGSLDASVTLSNNDWDMAAGVAIAREAGALVTDLDGAPHGTSSAATIAAAPAVSAELLALLREAVIQATHPGVTAVTEATPC